jgi:hypothetical protein
MRSETSVKNNVLCHMLFLLDASDYPESFVVSQAVLADAVCFPGTTIDTIHFLFLN